MENDPKPIAVTYVTTAEYSGKSETFQSLVAWSSTSSEHSVNVPLQSDTDSPQSPSTLERHQSTLQHKVTLRVISPIFYSRFFHFRTLNEAFESELLDDERTRTLWSSDPALFASIFPPGLFSGEKPAKFPISSNKYHWQILSALRKAPLSTKFPRTVPYRPFQGLSDMDMWIIRNCSPQHVREYRRALLRTFIGERFGGTFGPLARLSDDLELIGMSRDAVLRVYEAGSKVCIVVAAVEYKRVLDAACDFWNIGFAEWLYAGLNVWALLKYVC